MASNSKFLPGFVHFELNFQALRAKYTPIMPVTEEKHAAGATVSPAQAQAMAALQAEVIEHFVEISKALGQPRSFAEIYGLLFISPEPLAMDDLCARLQISKGSASQGLKFLREIGAVRVVERNGDRRTRYEAVAELRRLAGRFLRDQIGPRLAGSDERLANLERQLEAVDGQGADHAASRITMLRSWNKNIRRVLPLIVKLLGG